MSKFKPGDIIKLDDFIFKLINVGSVTYTYIVLYSTCTIRKPGYKGSWFIDALHTTTDLTQEEKALYL